MTKVIAKFNYTKARFEPCFSFVIELPYNTYRILYIHYITLFVFCRLFKTRNFAHFSDFCRIFDDFAILIVFYAVSTTFVILLRESSIGREKQFPATTISLGFSFMIEKAYQTLHRQTDLSAQRFYVRSRSSPFSRQSRCRLFLRHSPQ